MLKNNVAGLTTVEGTGPAPIGPATGRTPWTTLADGTVVFYGIVSSDGYEFGRGTWRSGSTWLERDSVINSSNGGSLVAWGPGTKDIFIALPAQYAIYVDPRDGKVKQIPENGLSGDAIDGGVISGAALTGKGIDTTAAPVTAVTVTSNGNVGIGMNSPSAKLHVGGNQDSFRAGNSGSVTNLYLGSAAAGEVDSKISFDRATGAFTYSYGVVGSYTERLRIDLNGNVGIGTSAPTRHLTVGDGTGVRFASINGGVDAGGAWLIERGGSLRAAFGNWSAIFGGAFNGTNVLYSADELAAFVYGAERLRITSSGNVGIGTSSPGVRLDAATADSTAVRAAATTNGVDARLMALGLTGNVGQVGTWSAHPFVIRTSDVERTRVDTSGNLLVGVTSGSNHVIYKNVSEGTELLTLGSSPSTWPMAVFGVSGLGWNAAACAVRVGKNSTTNRSINAGGTINASGADYAEYETRADGCPEIAKGQIVGFNADGKLTLTWAEAVSFGVKSTDPCLVGGDVWGTEEQIGPRPVEPIYAAPEYTGRAMPEEGDSLYDLRLVAWQSDQDAYRATVARAEADHVAAVAAYEVDLQAWSNRLEAARSRVDRIGYSGKVPVRLADHRGDRDAIPGDYLVAVPTDAGGIGWTAVQPDTISLAEYRRAVGQVRRLLPDGRPEIALKTC